MAEKKNNYYLGIDAGEHMGFAVISDCVKDFYEERFNPKCYVSAGKRLKEVYTFIYSFISGYKRKGNSVYVATEKLFFGNRDAEIMYSYVALIKMACAEFNIVPFEVHPATLKKFATGNGRATKEDMMVSAIEKIKIRPGKNQPLCATTHNMIDALWLAQFAKTKVERLLK